MLKKSASGVLASLRVGEAYLVKRRSFARYERRTTRYESAALLGEMRVLARRGGRVRTAALLSILRMR